MRDGSANAFDNLPIRNSCSNREEDQPAVPGIARRTQASFNSRTDFAIGILCIREPDLLEGNPVAHEQLVVS
jgi:hypothetical protein